MAAKSVFNLPSDPKRHGSPLTPGSRNQEWSGEGPWYPNRQSSGKNIMTGYTVHTGSNDNFRAGWDEIFSSEASKKPAAKKKKKKATGKSSAKKKTGKSGRKKS